MSRLILPPSLTRPTPSFAPPVPQRSVCTCGFEADAEHTRAFLQHVRRCAADRQPEFEARIARQAETYFTSSPDPERDAHFSAGGN